MDNALFDELKQTLANRGPAEAIDQLCVSLRERKEYSSLFYALLMKKRHELGVSPLPTAPNTELPENVHEPYEEGIRQAGREVGRLLLDQGDIVQASAYFRMLGEVEPVREALEAYQPFDGEDLQPLVELAFHHGAHPRRGFEWVLQRHGICTAITLLGSALQAGTQFPHGDEARDHCIKALVRSLHEQLLERVRNEIVQREGTVDAALPLPQLLAGRDWLFEEENYHIDVSHLSSVVQMTSRMGPCAELKLARELCAYGAKLSPRFQYAGEPPFEDLYRDYGVFLSILDGDNVEAGIAHFEAKAEAAAADPDGANTIPAEVLVNLLLRINQPKRAVAVAKRFLADADERQLSCPGVSELCRRVSDYGTLAEVARGRGDAVQFVAGLILANGK